MNTGKQKWFQRFIGFYKGIIEHFYIVPIELIKNGRGVNNSIEFLAMIFIFKK